MAASAPKDPELHALRGAVDAADDRVRAALVERMRLAREVGRLKNRLGLPVFDPAREREILERQGARRDDALPPGAVAAIWREILSASRRLQAPVKVAYLGPEGTFTQQAAMARFGASADYAPAATLAGAFRWLVDGLVDHAVLPVENTLQGVVGETLDLLGALGEPLVTGEWSIAVHFVFAARAERLEEVRRIYSKREAFLQCSDFLRQPALEKARQTEVASTAAAARRAADDPGGAALSTEIAATLAGVPVRRVGVEDNPRNRTRFFLLGRERPAPTGRDRTSVFCKAPHRVGGLVDVLAAFRDAGVNLTRLESRPMDDADNFETWFYIDFEGHADEPRVRRLIDEHRMIWLGSYPRESPTP